MSKYLSGHFAARVILAACCLALIDKRSSALFLGNLIGCTTFGCRIAALEQDVSQLKMQVMRLGGNGMNNGFQQPYNPNQQMQGGMMNQLPNQFNQNGQQQQQQQQGQLNQQGGQPQQGNNPATRATYANMAAGEYPQELRRVQGVPYQNPLNGQFMGA